MAIEDSATLKTYFETGKSPTENFNLQNINSSEAIKLFTIFLKWERTTLNKRIKNRTFEMFKKGWIKEVKNLLQLQLEQNKKFPPLDSIGYKHIKRFLDNEISKAEMVKTIYIRTRQLARRQEKWFKKEPVDLYIMMNSLEHEKIYKILDCFLKRIA